MYDTVQNTQKIMILKDQVGGKEPKLLYDNGRKILKKYTQSESQFYERCLQTPIHSPYYSIIRYIPQYYGNLLLEFQPIIQIEDDLQQRTYLWLEHLKQKHKYKYKNNSNNRFIIMNNITFKYESVRILDVKIGVTNGFNCNYIRVHGLKLMFNNQETLFLNKYDLRDVQQWNDTRLYFMIYFYDGNNITWNVLSKAISQLKDLILAFWDFTGFKCSSTSLCFFSENQPQRSKSQPPIQIKWIDFQYITSQKKISSLQKKDQDQLCLRGLQNILRMLIEIQNMQQSVAINEIESKLQSLRNSSNAIPKDKQRKYRHK